MFKVAVIGGENMGDYKLFAQKCVHFLKNRASEGIIILSSGDRYVDVFAKATNIDVKQYNVDWGKFGKNALKSRNIKMIEECDAVIIFDDGTKDTHHFMEMSRESGKPIRVVRDI